MPPTGRRCQLLCTGAPARVEHAGRRALHPAAWVLPGLLHEPASKVGRGFDRTVAVGQRRINAVAIFPGLIELESVLFGVELGPKERQGLAFDERDERRAGLDRVGR
eukprot:CAMPEP_0119519492 /NCGR_PEP_ID=MMETSP1344-20130328/35782_1 /TAXON_ID=236787 /ORGANISM="Florenciella parvula, Strain CCMP2471" /LENGTH=106 /DNA_ID=CAMNT_0007557275 /DNA_START=50 /DNA_END=371 /DNA_ORIENTATION=+